MGPLIYYLSSPIIDTFLFRKDPRSNSTSIASVADMSRLTVPVCLTASPVNPQTSPSRRREQEPVGSPWPSRVPAKRKSGAMTTRTALSPSLTCRQLLENTRYRSSSLTNTSRAVPTVRKLRVWFAMGELFRKCGFLNCPRLSGEGRKRNQISVGSCSEVSLPGKVSDSEIRSLNASIQAPSGLEEPCFLKRLPNGNLGKFCTALDPMTFDDLLSAVRRCFVYTERSG